MLFPLNCGHWRRLCWPGKFVFINLTLESAFLYRPRFLCASLLSFLKDEEELKTHLHAHKRRTNQLVWTSGQEPLAGTRKCADTLDFYIDGDTIYVASVTVRTLVLGVLFLGVLFWMCCISFYSSSFSVALWFSFSF